MVKGTILSGMRPTGKLHIGHLQGALSNWVRLQDEYRMFCEIADLHALTTAYEQTFNLHQNTLDVAMDFISAGIDPERSAIFVQSHVHEHSELHLLLSMITPVSWLERVPTYKGQIEELQIASPGYGLLGYPVLQAADILLYKADVVPVGKDQVPHLELTREIARRFNNLYGPIFPEPQAMLTEEAEVVPGLDGRKMSKSYGNAVNLSETPEDIRAKVAQMFTDPQKIHKRDPGRPEICPVWIYHRFYHPATAEQAALDCRAGELGCVDHKRALAEYVVEALAPMREKRRELEGQPQRIEQLLRDGAERARAVARQTLAEVKAAMKISES